MREWKLVIGMVHPQEQGMAPYKRVVEDKMASCASMGILRDPPKRGEAWLNEKLPDWEFCCASTGIRTPVLTLKGSRPGPLDDGGINGKILPKDG